MSKFLSFVLRHEPQAIGLVPDRSGWVEIEQLLERCRAHGKPLSREILETIVATSSKRRFAISDDRRLVRANQGHSIEVDLGCEPCAPPDLLFHGTVASKLAAIRAEGLKKMGRHHVHLSPDAETARIVGTRRGKPVVLRIAAAKDASSGSRVLSCRERRVAHRTRALVVHRVSGRVALTSVVS